FSVMQIIILIIFIYLTGFTLSYSQKAKNSFEKWKIEFSNRGDDNGKQTYINLLQRFLAQDTTMQPKDFQELMISYALQPGFHVYDQLFPLEDSLVLLRQEGFYATILDLCQKTILPKYPLSLHAYIEGAFAARELGFDSLYQDYFTKYNLLLQGILISGNGKSKSTAFILINPNDAYLVLNYFELESLLFDFEETSHGFYDIHLTEHKKTGLTQKLYFDVSIPLLTALEIEGGREKLFFPEQTIR
ncbi:MAG: DUF4919 domain-containing protein, partial [Bacteroidia bacterium]|nr:DUF4919 domain-containing protein [Bacteroidia bacterium]